MIVKFDEDNFSIKLYRDFVKGKLVGLMEVIPIDELLEVWADRKTENSSEKPNNSTISKMEQVDKDINVRSKDEPTTQTKTQKSNLSFEKADEPQTEDFKACVEGLTLLWIYNYVTDDEFHRIDARLKCKDEPHIVGKHADMVIIDEPQTEQVGVPFGEMDEATFKSHCLNCRRDTADIKCLDCDGDKYFLPCGSQTDCAWK